MQTDINNKGLSNALYGLLSGLKFQKIIADTQFAGRDTTVTNKDTIYVTNFVFRDKNNDTVSTSTVQIELKLFLLLLRTNSDFAGFGLKHINNVLRIIQVYNNLSPGKTDLSGAGYLDYSSGMSQVSDPNSRTPDNVLNLEDILIFLRYYNNIEVDNP